MRVVALVLLGGCAGASVIPPQVARRLEGVGEARVAGRSELWVRCSQPDAELAIDGVTQGTCRDFERRPLVLARGSRQVSVTKPGYYPWQSWVEADGTSVVVEVTLSSKGGSTP